MIIIMGRVPMAEHLKCWIVASKVSEFKLHSRYYIHFRTNTLEKGMNLLILPQLWVK